MGNIVKNMFVLGLGAFSVLYLLNPTAGWLEFIPDVLPIVGNIDEGIAVTALFGVARYYGIDLIRPFERD